MIAVVRVPGEWIGVVETGIRILSAQTGDIGRKGSSGSECTEKFERGT